MFRYYKTLVWHICGMTLIPEEKTHFIIAIKSYFYSSALTIGSLWGMALHWDKL